MKLGVADRQQTIDPPFPIGAEVISTDAGENKHIVIEWLVDGESFIGETGHAYIASWFKATGRRAQRFCPKCGLQTEVSSMSGNGCCPANVVLVYADSIKRIDGAWTYECVENKFPRGEPVEERPMPRQQQIPGTERKRNPKLVEAMEEYKKLRDKAIGANNKAKAAKDHLLELARENMADLVEIDGEYVFVDDETHLKLVYTNKENVKIRTLKDGEDGDGDE